MPPIHAEINLFHYFCPVMNVLDIIIAIILLFFGIKGLKKGLIIEIVSLLAFGIGIYGAMHFSDFTAETMTDYIEINPKYIDTTAFILTFIILVILVNVIGKLVSKMVRDMNLGTFNKIGGFVFGGAKGVLLCSLLLMVLNNFQIMGFVKPEVKEQSFLYPHVEKTVPFIYQGFDIVKDAIEDMQESGQDDNYVADTVSVP